MPHQGPPAAQIQSMFAELASTYDALNRALSFGVDARWRKQAARAVKASGAMSVLDVATGTGDLAAELLRTLGPASAITGTDFCEPLLDIARRRHGDEIGFIPGDAMALPFEDARFDAATIAFGIRNVADPVKALREMARVVKPGGTVVVLEFGQPRGAFGALFQLYSRAVMVPLGGLVSQKPAAYRWLVESSAKFPAGGKFTALMDEAGSFSSTSMEPLTGGIALLYRGVVRAAEGQ